MKILNKISYLLLGGLFLLGSCSEDFLEEQPTRSLTKKRLSEISELNPVVTQSLVPGLYSMTFKHGTGGTSSHDDFGQKSYDITSDIMSGDMAQEKLAYTRFELIAKLDLTRTSLASYRVWRYYYQVVRSANDLIAAFNDEMPQEASSKASYGQAKAMRAYAYLYLVNFIQNPYMDAKSKKSIVLSLKNDDVAKPLSTVEEIYKVIIDDLETAVKALDGFTRIDKSYINQNVARGLLTYAYLFKGDYVKAEEASNAVIVSNEFTMMNKKEILESGFNNVNIPGWMWAIDLTEDNTPYLPTFWGMVDVFTYSYAPLIHLTINKELYETIPTTDLRKEQFQGDLNKKFYLHPIGKFYHKDKQEGTRDWTSDEVYMRVAEMYLAKAEAQARQGNDAGAKETLLTLLKERDTDATTRVNSLSGEALLDEIYFQWRIEMWGEGKAFWAMKRFKKTNKRGTNSVMYPGEEFKYDDPRLLMSIPEVEYNSNPEISK